MKTFQLQSVMPNGMYKGRTIAWIIDYDPQYLLWVYKRRQIKLSRSATVAMTWKTTGHLPNKISDREKSRLTIPDKMSYEMFEE